MIFNEALEMILLVWLVQELWAGFIPAEFKLPTELCPVQAQLDLDFRGAVYEVNLICQS